MPRCSALYAIKPASCAKDDGLLWCGLQLYDHGPVHAESISYSRQFFNTEKEAVLPSTLERCGYPRRIYREESLEKA
jgi:hypothetical protein